MSLAECFEKQKELIARFHEIEHPTYPKLNTLAGQQKLRLTLLFFLEEIYEAATSLPQTNELEELVDSLHFLIEAALFAGLPLSEIEEAISAIDDYDRATYQDLFLDTMRVVHQLKHKPWKQNPKPTNENQMRDDLLIVFTSFFVLVYNLRYSKDQLFEGYHAKHKINHQRIDSGV